MRLQAAFVAASLLLPYHCLAGCSGQVSVNRQLSTSKITVFTFFCRHVQGCVCLCVCSHGSSNERAKATGAQADEDSLVPQLSKSRSRRYIRKRKRDSLVIKAILSPSSTCSASAKAWGTSPTLLFSACFKA